MAYYPKIEGIGNIGSIILAIWEVQVPWKLFYAQVKLHIRIVHTWLQYGSIGDLARLQYGSLYLEGPGTL